MKRCNTVEIKEIIQVVIKNDAEHTKIFRPSEDRNDFQVGSDQNISIIDLCTYVFFNKLINNQ